MCEPIPSSDLWSGLSFHAMDPLLESCSQSNQLRCSDADGEHAFASPAIMREWAEPRRGWDEIGLPWIHHWHPDASRSIYRWSRRDREGLERSSLRRTKTRGSVGGHFFFSLLLLGSLLVMPTWAAFIDFSNCLSQSVQTDTPYQLQFVPKFFDAVFNTTNSSHQLRVTVWGNVTGSLPLANLPSANDNGYWNDNSTANNNGKIVDLPYPNGANKFTTLFNKVNVLTYEPWSKSVDFCNQLVNASCPLMPSFHANGSDPYDLPSFGFSNSFFSTYAFTSFTASLRIVNGDPDATAIGCITANITPDLGSSLSGVLKFLPLLVLIFVAFATAFAAIYSPWGTTDVFRWTTNYGRDPDLLRLVTPGLGDCLQYIQFIALTGGLTLSYPGYYQPVVSKVAWSALMFNQSLVSRGSGTESLVDGIYVTHGRFGLDILRQLVGMQEVDDVWAGMIVWLLSTIAITLLLIQLGLFARWSYRKAKNTLEEDLRAKNLPFSMGIVIQIIFNYFLLPIVALSMFQLVEAGHSPASTVGLAAITLILIVGFSGWLLFLIASTTPKSVLFDELPVLMLYGSLYNTYSDNAAPFTLVPVLLTFLRGIAIGAVQASGIAQLVLLAICEVITVLTLHAFRPFHSPTSMNAYHTFFAVFRFGTILLMVSFSPSLGVTDGPKGWVGYAILLMHGIVLLCGFLLNAIQTIVEVAARLAGAGGDETGATRGGLVKVFGMRQLSRRLPRRDAATSRQSQLSSTAMLGPDHDKRSLTMNIPGGRAASIGSAGNLLNRNSSGLDSYLGDGSGSLARKHPSGVRGSTTPPTPGVEAIPFSLLPDQTGVEADMGAPARDASAPWYRPPRSRRPGNDTPDASRRFWKSGGDCGNKRLSLQADSISDNRDLYQGPSMGIGPSSPQTGSDGTPNENWKSKADYTTREVDFYYGVRGRALNSHVPSRRIKTGPTDPTGPTASAVGWVKRFFDGKTKEKGKGFEVVRSAKMPPGMMKAAPPPDGVPVATGGIRKGPIDSDDDDDTHGSPPQRKLLMADGNGNQDLVDPNNDTGTYNPKNAYESFGNLEVVRTSKVPPVLPGLDIGYTDIELPSRSPSKASKESSPDAEQDPMADIPLLLALQYCPPSVPPKSSRRKSLPHDPSNAGTSAQHLAQNSIGPSSHRPLDRDTSSQSSLVDDVPDVPNHLRNMTSALGRYATDVRGDRPTSVGYVSHNIRTVNRPDDPGMLGTSAEVMVYEQEYSRSRSRGK